MRGRDLRAGLEVILVWKARARPGVALDQDAVAAANELVNSGRRHGHAELLLLDFFWDSDGHKAFSLAASRQSATVSVPSFLATSADAPLRPFVHGSTRRLPNLLRRQFRERLERHTRTGIALGHDHAIEFRAHQPTHLIPGRVQFVAATRAHG